MSNRFINISRMLWAFNFSKKKSPTTGDIINVDTSTEKGWMNIPNHFACQITVRSPERADLIRSIFADAEAKGLEYEFRKR